MDDSFASPGIDAPSPTLSARLRELADYLGAPTAGRLTEEQRALSLGIARRLVADVAAWLHRDIDADALWRDWLRGGLPGAERLAATCFARGEEHRWREQTMLRGAAPSLVAEPEGGPGEDPAAIADKPLSDIERAYLALRIADRRRFDGLGNPCLAIADLDGELFHALLLDVAAWRLVQGGKDDALAAELRDAVRTSFARHGAERGIDGAAQAYHDILAASAALPETAATAIARQDWPTLVALAAAAHRRRYGDMALALLTAEAATLPSLLAPLRIDRAALAPLEASLAMLSGRAIAGGFAGEGPE